MKRTALILMILTIVSKIIGFGREITLSYFYGASGVSDAYLIALTIPAVVFAMVGTGINTSYIPIYSSILRNRDYKAADKFTSNLINHTLIVCSFIILIGIIFAEPLVKLFAIGFEGETLRIAVKFTRISFFGIYFTLLTYIFSGYLNLKNNFVIPALIGIPLNIITIISIILSKEIDIIILPIGNVISILSQVILLLVHVNKKGYMHSFTVDKKDENIKKMFYLALPVILGVSVNQINILIDRTLASKIVTGGISALNYANRLNLFVQSIIVTSIITVVYPKISEMAAKNDMNSFKRLVSESISGISLLVIPATIGMMVFAEPIVTLLYGRGEFDIEAINMTTSALFYYSIGMLGVGLREVLSKAFYSLQDTKTPMVNAAIAIAINIVLNVILSRFLGIGGLALATSISSTICTIFLLISLRIKIGFFGIKGITISIIKIVISSLIMGGLAKVMYEIMNNQVNNTLSLLISIAVGIIVYFLTIYFVKIDVANEFIDAIKKKLI